MAERDDLLDCLVIGGGPAGLTAAIYLARFRLRVTVIDAGGGRAAMIPRTRNHAGFPGGVPGPELLARMREQAAEYGAALHSGRVDRLVRLDDGFSAEAGASTVRARTVLLATGVTNLRPDMPQTLHDAALASGRLRYCPVCDGYEVTDQRVGVIGTGAHGAREAEFVRGFTADVTLVAPEGPHQLDPPQRARMAEIGVTLVDGPVGDFRLQDGALDFACGAGRLEFEAVYPAMGSRMHSELARDLGADLTDEGCVRVDAHQRTSAPGLYAAGDVVIGLDQISHAMGEAGVAATAIRNDLAERAPLLR